MHILSLILWSLILVCRCLQVVVPNELPCELAQDHIRGVGASKWGDNPIWGQEIPIS